MSGVADVSMVEVLGLKPYGLTLQQAKFVFAGDPLVPPSRWDTTSLNIFTPRMSVPTWRGEKVCGRTIPILNLVNRVQTPVEDGWSVRVTQVRDFRGGALTYDSHNGTDFVIPPGTTTVAAAAGRVCAIRREWNRGGLKIYVDHGDGLLTTYNHLARQLVEVGDVVNAGDALALTGYSGLDGFIGFPFLAPHVHWNVILGGVLVDPFGVEGEVPLWVHGNEPRPLTDDDQPDEAPPTTFEADLVQQLLDDLKDDELRRKYAQISDVTQRGLQLMIESTVYPTRFKTPEAGRMLYPDPPERSPRIFLPFLQDDYDDVAFADDLGFRETVSPASG